MTVVLFIIMCVIVFTILLIKKIGFLSFLLCIVLPLVALVGIGFLVLMAIVNKEEKEQNDYLNSPQGKKEVEELIAKMESYGIVVPKNDTITAQTVSNYRYLIADHFEKNYVPDGLVNVIDLDILDSFNFDALEKFKKIRMFYKRYNKKEVFVFGYHPITSKYHMYVTKTGIKYSSDISNSNVSDLSTFFESLEKNYDKSYITYNSKKIAMEDFYWRTEGGISGQGSLVHIASGAILGGVFGGPIGAVLGGASSDKDNDKSNEKRTLVIGTKDTKGYRWTIKELKATDIDSDYTVKELEEHFPNNRLPNLYYSSH